MKTPAQLRASRAYNERNREQISADNRARYERLRGAEWSERQLWYKHKLTPESRRLIWQAQGGCCYLCERELDLCTAVVEHDHRCCKPGWSCERCRRGLAHSMCNKAIGMLGDDVELIERVVRNLKAANELLEGRDQDPS